MPLAGAVTFKRLLEGGLDPASQSVSRAQHLHTIGTPKHLLLRGPASLATAIGLSANGTGPTYVPFYDGPDAYVGGLWIG